MTKRCKACFEFKPIDDFYSHPETSDRKENKCKSCKKEYVSFWQKHNPFKCQKKTAKHRRKKFLES